MPVRAVLFDIDDTLYPSTHFSAMARRRAVEAMVRAGLEVPVEVAWRELQEVVREFTSNYGHHFDNLVLRLGSNLRPGVHPAIIVAAGVVAYHESKQSLAPFPDVVPALRALERTRLLRGVVTNGFVTKQSEKLVRLHLHELFSPNALFISEELGVAKPHPKIFQIACERIGVETGDAIYVGDHPTKDIDPAHEAGMLTCLRRGEGHYANAVGVCQPDMVVRDLLELVAVLKDRQPAT